MSSPLAILGIIGVVAICALLTFVLQMMVSPRLVAGTLSEAQPEVCNQGKQWITYGCEPNPLTGFGCIFPGGDSRSLTYKTSAIQVSPCLPVSGATGVSGDRIISFRWELQDLAVCRTMINGSYTGPDCCQYNQSCSQRAKYLCRETSAGVGGENQCTPSYLPVPYPQFNNKDNRYTVDPIYLDIPCRQEYCKPNTL